MNIKKHKAYNIEISEVIEQELFIGSADQSTDILGNIETDRVVLYARYFEEDFFDLSTKKLGEFMQKFANYRVRLAIVGDFSKYPSKTLKDFIYESNKDGDYLFVSTVDEVLERWKQI
ncbi:MAG: DUF4180 domain-containing protein [Patescibacteria group bacterium]